MIATGRLVFPWLAALVVLGAFSGCAPVALIHPLAPATLGQQVEERQQVTIDYRGQRHSLQVALKVAPDDLTLIGLSPIGQRLFTLSWDGHDARVTSTIADARRLPAQRILADLQLAYWPLPVLRQALADPAMRLEQQGQLRTLWRGDALLWMAYRQGQETGRRMGDIDWTRSMTIYNGQGPYRLTVQPLALDGQPP